MNARELIEGSLAGGLLSLECTVDLKKRMMTDLELRQAMANPRKLKAGTVILYRSRMEQGESVRLCQLTHDTKETTGRLGFPGTEYQVQPYPEFSGGNRLRDVNDKPFLHSGYGSFFWRHEPSNFGVQEVYPIYLRRRSSFH